MDDEDTPGGMTPDQLRQALADLEWSQADLCRKSGVNKNTPGRWLSGESRIPAWVPAYLGAVLEIKRLHAKYVQR